MILFSVFLLCPDFSWVLKKKTPRFFAIFEVLEVSIFLDSSKSKALELVSQC